LEKVKPLEDLTSLYLANISGVMIFLISDLCPAHLVHFMQSTYSTYTLTITSVHTAEARARARALSHAKTHSSSHTHATVQCASRHTELKHVD
jgi:hypothetical protein